MKKIFALTFIVLLCGFIFCGCGDNNSNSIATHITKEEAADLAKSKVRSYIVNEYPKIDPLTTDPSGFSWQKVYFNEIGDGWEGTINGAFQDGNSYTGRGRVSFSVDVEVSYYGTVTMKDSPTYNEW